MKKWVVKEKQIGETPLEVAENYRKEAELAADVSIAYAGRLDPMASGKVLLLLGDECKKQKDYFGLDKEYEFEVLFGASTDTGDVLGLLTNTKSAHPLSSVQPPEVAQIGEVVRGLVGKQTFPYPKFSSKTVQGKPLHMWTLEGKLDEIEIPTTESSIYNLRCTDVRTVSETALRETIFEKINSFTEVTDPKKALGADFRRAEVRQGWHDYFEHKKDRNVHAHTR